MTNGEMIAQYFAALHQLEARHARLVSEMQVYDKRVALLEEEMDEIWEVIAALRRHEKGALYGWRGNGVSAGLGGTGVSGLLGV